MLQSLSSTLTAITAFSNQHSITPIFQINSAGELRGHGLTREQMDAAWASFEWFAGVYCIIPAKGQSIKYIGMSLSDTGSRVHPWIKPEPINADEPGKSMEDSDIVLSIVLADEPYMAPALESYLISKLNPTFNIKS